MRKPSSKRPTRTYRNQNFATLGRFHKGIEDMTTDLYNPNLSLLSKMGIDQTSFRPEDTVRNALLCRLSLEQCLVTSPLSYYRASQPELGLLRLVSGSLVFTSLPGETHLSLSGNCLFLFNCAFPHRIKIQNGAEYRVLYFGGQSLPYFTERLFSGTPFRLLPFSAERASELHFLFEEREADPLFCHICLSSLLAGTILEEKPPEKNIPPYLRALKSELETHYYQKYTLEELEQKYRKNKYRICRDFKDCFQTPPLQYLHRMRIQAAKDLLIETDMKVHEISYEVGYENVNHFIAHFKKFAGTTPTAYRCRF